MTVDATLTGAKGLQRKLKDLGQLNLVSAKSAMPRATKSARAYAVKEIGTVLNMPAARLKQAILSDAGAVYVKGWLHGKDDTPTLRAYGAKFRYSGKRYRGAVARTWRGLGNQYYQPAFGIPKAPGVPFKRRGPRRTSPITPIYGPRPGKVFDQIHNEIRGYLFQRFRAEWARKIRGRLARK